MKAILLAVSLFTCGLTSCASGPDYKAIADRIPPVPEHCGRIYFFRSSVMGTLVHPDVLLNGTVVGESVPGGFFFVDEPAGDYEVGIFAGGNPRWVLHLGESQTSYVRTFVQLNDYFNAYPVAELVDSPQGEEAVRGLKYTGPELPAPKPTP